MRDSCPSNRPITYGLERCCSLVALMLAIGCQPVNDDGRSFDADPPDPRASRPASEVDEGQDATPIRSANAVAVAASDPAPSPPRTAYPAAAAPMINPTPRVLVGSESGNNSFFGLAVALDESQAIVGATGSRGDYAGYFFAESGSSWTESAKLARTPLSYSAWMGGSVAIDGGYSAVGAPRDDLDSLTSAGAVYVLQRAGTDWSQQAKLRANEAGAYAQFGDAIAIQGDRLLIGAPGHQAVTAGPVGRAYVFERAAGGWSEDAMLSIAGDVGLLALGSAVDLDGDTLVIGAPKYRDAGGVITGAAYIFVRSANAWSEEGPLTGSDSATGDRFGASVSLSQGRVLVGAPDHDSETKVNAGAGYVFLRSASAWSEEAKFDYPAPAPASAALPIQPVIVIPGPDLYPPRFGTTVSIWGELALVGSPYIPFGTVERAGAAYLFSRTGSSWSQVSKLTSPVPTATAGFATSVDMAGGRALIGSFRETVGQVMLTGAAFLYGLSQPGNACVVAADCASNHCSDGVCCDTACDGSCDQCDLPTALGSCTLLSAGTAVGDCLPYLCDGARATCLEQCKLTADCAADHFCSDDACTPRHTLRAACDLGEQCLGGHCSDGVCCDTACDGPCDSCGLEGSSGTCRALPQGDLGAPSCAPLVCDGLSASCPTTCGDESDCAPDHHCNAGTCTTNFVDGEACSSAMMCRSGLCTDGLCCISANCAPYACGPGGTCHTSCGSSADCASGFQCSSGSQCEAIVRVEGENALDGGCTVVAAPGSAPSQWIHLLAMLGLLGSRRRRRCQKLEHSPSKGTRP